MDSPTYTLNDFKREQQNLVELKSKSVRDLKEEEKFHKPVALATKSLAHQLWRVTHSTKKNELCSPYGISMLLGLIRSGTGGQTDTEIQTVCHFPECPYMQYRGFSGLMEHLMTVSPNANLMVANAVFVAEGNKFTDWYLQCADPYVATLRQLNFSNSSTTAWAEIDRWVSDVTGRKIGAIVSTEDVDLKTKLVFVNVMTFKGYWARGFWNYDTQELPFYVSESKTVKVPFMTATYKAPIADLPQFTSKALGLQYKDRHMTLIIILPNQRDGLRELLKKLDGEFYTNVRNRLRIVGEVNVTIPKWKQSSKLELKSVMQNMGIKSLFNNTADLSGMLDKPEGMYVSDVIQKTMIEISEEGDEAPTTSEEDPASACAPTGMPTAKFPIQDTPVSFTANHPFMYYVYDDKFGVVLCSGTQSFT